MVRRIAIILFRIQSYLQYYWRSKDNHYLHSPFAFGWYQRMKTPIEPSVLKTIEQYRKNLDQSSENFILEEHGESKSIPISHRYRQTSISHDYGQLIHQTAAYIHASSFLELGTSLGVSTAYLARANSNIHGKTIDYQKSAKEFASREFQKMGWENVEFIVGSFESVLPTLLSKENPMDVVFIDGDHSYAATVQNTIAILPSLSSHAVIILDDIRWSPEMYRAWEELKGRAEFKISIDFGRMGLLFHVDHKTVKQDFVLR